MYPPPPAIVAPPPPSPVVTTEEPPPNLHLLGVIQGAHDIAIVRHGDDPKTETLSSGDHVGPWEVTVLPTVGIRLTSGTRAFDYALFAKVGAPTEPTAVVPPDAVPAGPTTDRRQRAAAKARRLTRGAHGSRRFHVGCTASRRRLTVLFSRAIQYLEKTQCIKATQKQKRL